jgi:hypothetical protein
MGDEKDQIIGVLSHLFVRCCKQETIEPEADVADVMEYVNKINIGGLQLTLERLFRALLNLILTKSLDSFLVEFPPFCLL